MLISSRKELLQNTPFKIAASKSRQKCPYFKSGNAPRFNTYGYQRPCWEQQLQAWGAAPWWWLGGIQLGYFPTGRTAIARIGKSWITFCREKRDGQIYNRAIDSRLPPFQNNRQILVCVGAEFQKDTMDRERKKCLSSPKPAYCCSSSVWTNNRGARTRETCKGQQAGSPGPPREARVTRTSKWRSGLSAWVWLYWETMHPLHNLTPIKTEIQSRYSLTSKAKQVTERGHTNPGLRPRTLHKKDPLPLPWL